MTTTHTDRIEPSGETLQFMQRMWELVHALDVRSKRMVKAVGVTGPQRLVIRIIGQKPNQTASQIAMTLGKHPSTLTGVLARLQQRGMITREADAEDRRRARFALTAGGKKIDKLQKGTVEAAVRRSLGRTTEPKIEGMRELLALLVEELERND
jgi:MarR family transcriptional regulator, organic hydroperoxide resistance regulator